MSSIADKNDPLIVTDQLIEGGLFHVDVHKGSGAFRKIQQLECSGVYIIG